MKKLIVLVLVASFAGAVVAQQNPPQRPVPQNHANKDKKDKRKHHHHHRHEHKPTDKK